MRFYVWNMYREVKGADTQKSRLRGNCREVHENLFKVMVQTRKIKNLFCSARCFYARYG